jgi:hypothetical protein
MGVLRVACAVSRNRTDQVNLRPSGRCCRRLRGAENAEEIGQDEHNNHPGHNVPDALVSQYRGRSLLSFLLNARSTG